MKQLGLGKIKPGHPLPWMINQPLNVELLDNYTSSTSVSAKELEVYLVDDAQQTPKSFYHSLFL